MLYRQPRISHRSNISPNSIFLSEKPSTTCIERVLLANRQCAAIVRERTSAGLAVARAEGRIGGRRKKLDTAKRREIAESVISGRKSGADMARLYNVSQPTISRIVAAHRA